MNPTNWGPGLIVLVAGVVAGVLFVVLSRRGAAPAAQAPDALADLEQRYQSLIGQVEELIASRHQLPAEAFEAEKARLEGAAARALKAREQFRKTGQHEADKAAARAAKASAAAVEAPGGKWRGALIAIGAVAFFIVVGLVLSQETGARTDGGTMTGRGPSSAMGEEAAGPAEDHELASVMARLNMSPDDPEALGAAAHLFIVRDDYSHAATLTERGLAIDPFHIESRVHRAVLKAMKGDFPTARTELLHLADTFPQANEALLFAAAVATQLKDKPQALEMLERFWATASEGERSPGLRQQIDQLRREVGANN